MSYNALWTVPDSLWIRMVKLLPPEKQPGTPGRPALPHRQVVNGILYVLRTGCHWKSLHTGWFGASRSIHARYQAWGKAHIWKKLFQLLLRFYAKRPGICWHWQAIDSKSVAALLGGEKTGKKPTDRGKLGAKRHILVDGHGAPLAIVLSGANAYDKTCALAVLNAQILPRPKTTYRVHYLCADKGYDYPDIRRSLRRRNYRVHIAKRGVTVVATPIPKRHPARRWVVERTLSWQNDFRSLRTRWSKKANNWLSFIYFASALVLWRMASQS